MLSIKATNNGDDELRYLIRNELDVSKPVNLRRLTPAMKIYAGIASRWHDSDTYKRRVEKRLEETHAASVQKDERLKEALLVQIFKELDNNQSLGEKGEVCDSLILCVQSQYIYSLDRVLRHKDFLPYEIEKIDEDTDLRTAFKDMPILIRVKKKLLQEVGI